MLDAAVCSHNGSVFYYQGLHDIASVLLFVMGERAACQTLSHLTCCQLRDCTRCADRPTLYALRLKRLLQTVLVLCIARSTLDAVLELLGLLMPILEEVISVASLLCMFDLYCNSNCSARHKHFVGIAETLCLQHAPPCQGMSLSCAHLLSALFDGLPMPLTMLLCIPYVQADAEVHKHLAKAEVPPFFALSWLITWFAHSVDDLQQISRLFDLFMASHPLMPLYVAALVIKVCSQLHCSCMSCQLLLHLSGG